VQVDLDSVSERSEKPAMSFSGFPAAATDSDGCLHNAKLASGKVIVGVVE